MIGWRVVVSTFMWERFNVITGGSRVIPGLADLLRTTGAATDPLARQRYARIYARAQTLRYTLLRLMTTLAQGGLPGPEGSVMKLVATDLLTDIFDLALDCLGPDGMGEGAGTPGRGSGTPASPAPRDADGGGTDFIQRNIIAERSRSG